MSSAAYYATTPADWDAAINQWEIKQWREEARLAKLLFLVAKVAGSDVELEDFLPPHPNAKETQQSNKPGQVALNNFLKSFAGVQTNRGTGDQPAAGESPAETNS